MTDKRFKIDLHPTIQDYEYIYGWMKEAFDKNLPNSGLFYNLHKEDFENGKVIVYRHNGKAEAILTYSLYDKDLTFYILSLNPNLHHQGIGTRFMTDVLNHFRKKRCIVADFYEPTKKGHRLLKRLGAVWKANPYNPKQYMFIKLLPSRKQNWNAKRRIVMWKSEPEEGQMPDFSWSLNFKNNNKPILAYAYYDWFLGIIQNGKCIYINKVKRFKGLGKSAPSDFLYVTSDTFIKQEDSAL